MSTFTLGMGVCVCVCEEKPKQINKICRTRKCRVGQRVTRACQATQEMQAKHP